VPTRTGKHRWDRSVIWGMLRNPAYAGTAVFGKTMVVAESPGLNRVAPLQGRATPCASKTVDRPREQGTTIPVPAIVSTDTFDRVARRLDDNKRFAARNSKVPSLLQGLAACACCGYGYYRTSTRTTNKTIYYYRCLGSDDYRYEGGRVCANKPVRDGFRSDSAFGARLGFGHRLDQIRRRALEDVAQGGQCVQRQPFRGARRQPVDLLAGEHDAPFGQQRPQLCGGEHAPLGHP
jgi:recombinase/recombinase-like zinc beta ribbon protein